MGTYPSICQKYEKLRLTFFLLSFRVKPLSYLTREAIVVPC